MQQFVVFERVNARPPERVGHLDWRQGIPVTGRLVIEERVRMEFERGTVMPRVEGYRPLSSRFGARDGENAVALTLKAFGRGSFFLFVGDAQVIDLDAEIVLKPGDEIVFVRLVPLKGG